MKSIVWQMNKLKPLEKYVLEYLLTNSHTTPIGYYYLPIEYVMKDLNLGHKSVKEAMDGLIEKGLMVYDFSAEVVAVGNYKNYYGFDVNSMQIDVFDTMPISWTFRKCFHWLSSCLSGEIARNIVSHDKVRKSLYMETDSTSSDELYYAGFDMFLAVYPNKMGIDNAVDNFMELVKTNCVDPADIIAAAINYEDDYKNKPMPQIICIEKADKFLDPETKFFSKYIDKKNYYIDVVQEVQDVDEECPF